MSRVDKQNGFTVIELMLAMAFVSVLMMAIAMTVMQLANMYNKGTTLRAVDQAGRAISRDMQTTLSSAQPLDVGTDGRDGLNFKSQVFTTGDASLPGGGRLCTGTYSYVWNTGRSLRQQRPVNTYEGSGDNEIRLIKVHDPGAAYCNNTAQAIAPDRAVELLSAGDRELAVQSLSIAREAVDGTTQQALYRIVLEVGTNDEGSLDETPTITSIDTTCKPPSDAQSQRDFCAVNRFEFTVRAGNKGTN